MKHGLTCYLVQHMCRWVNNWEDATEEFASRWLKQHIYDARQLGKPLLVEEFGAWGVPPYDQQRDGWYRLIYDTLAEVKSICSGMTN